jgi:protein phosphatase 2C family protein 2/3
MARRPNEALDTQLRTIMRRTDEHIYNTAMNHGSTAICAVLHDEMLAVASLGDSQAILCAAGHAHDLCMSHRPSEESERERIAAMKGTVINGRIFGVLGVSRAFGDNDFKTSKGPFKHKFNGDIVGGEPDVVVRPVTPDDEFLVLACDGIFDVLSPDELVLLVRQKLMVTNNVQSTADEVIQQALRMGSTDNLSVVIVCLNQHP